MNTQRVEGHTPTYEDAKPGEFYVCQDWDHERWFQVREELDNGERAGRSSMQISRQLSKEKAKQVAHACNNIERLEKVNEALVRALERLEYFTFNERWAMKGLDDDAQTVLNQVQAALALAKEPA